MSAVKLKPGIAKVRRRNEARAFALQLLLVAGYVPRPQFRQAMRIARSLQCSERTRKAARR